MTRQEIIDNYHVKDGRIMSLGKFEGEMIYVPFFYEAYLNGCANRDDGRCPAITLYSATSGVGDQ